MLELNLYSPYPRIMLIRCSHFFACMLLVLLPLQSLAAANMLVCNSLMQAEASQLTSAKQEAKQTMPCHQNMVINKTTDTHKSNCKTSCDALCASLCALTVFTNSIKPASLLNSSKAIGSGDQTYVSITQTNLQRPPIFLA
jgi:hypothetical protein